MSKRNYKKKEKDNKIVADALFERVCINLYGIFDLENFSGVFSKNEGYMLMIVDVYSRFTRIFSNEQFNAKEIIASFKIWCEEVGTPNKVISDNGRQFVSKEVIKDLKNNK